ncbi:hypothetical protein [Paenibacillus sp. 481]|uniref:hypothetical protein n=1 Tax=Paenibacillus sp. 481 TaxID=2835869 RepID=UPI001E3BF8A5|nr:hypothetical protein [Paenibacillus sp. 481]UHA72024.1 hypothetical protein KIK04_15030 [Paenibacillus sp. 481]
MSLKNLFLKVFVGSIALCVAIAVVLFLISDFSYSQLKILGTAFLVFLFSFLGIPIAKLFDDKKKAVGLIGLILLVVTLCWDLLFIWGSMSWDDEIWVKVLMIMNVWSVLGSVASLMWNIGFGQGYSKWVNFLTLGIIAVLTISLTVIVINNLSASDLSYRLLAVYAILIAAGVVITPILKKMELKNHVANTNNKLPSEDKKDQ